MKISAVLVTLSAVGIAGCMGGRTNRLPPAQMLMEPGPGVGGPGPGVMITPTATGMPGPTMQMNFVGPEGMRIAWDVSAPGYFDSVPLVCPGYYDFPQAAIYRLKLTHIPGRPAVELYPTLEIGPAVPRTEAFLAHNAVPVQFAEEDFDQVLSGNFVTKVVYLPDPEFQEFALAGVETLVSTRLDPGTDPIVEADRRGAILAVIRMGNKVLELPGEIVGDGQVVATSYEVPLPVNGASAPMGVSMGGETTMPAGYVSGVDGPTYGIAMSGTPIGLPGPPHVPLGSPAGLQKHTITNRTSVHVPEPTQGLRINVKQTPGLSYPGTGDGPALIQREFVGSAGSQVICN